MIGGPGSHGKRTGGVYLAGEVAVHTLPAINESVFFQRFNHKGRFAELMGRIPIHVVVTPAAIVGAAAYGLENATAGSAHG